MILIIESNFIVALSLKKSLKTYSSNIVIKATLKDSIEIICENKLECIIATEKILTEHGQHYNIHNYLIKRNIPLVLLISVKFINTSYDLNIIGVYYKPVDPDDICNSLSFLMMKNQLQIM
jgi:hypothetical protein